MRIGEESLRVVSGLARTISSVTAAVTLVALAGCGSATQRTPTPQTPQPPAADETKVLQPDPSIAPPLVVTTGCGESDLRLVLATLSWPPDRIRGDAARIDVTVFKNGFEQGLFASIPATGEGRFEPSPALQRMGRPPDRAFDLVAAPTRGEKETSALEVRHLEPGVLYRWRLVVRTDRGWVPGETTTSQAPVCVADEVKEP